MQVQKTIFKESRVLLLVAIVFSCTIIKDGDITSADQASKLKLTSINLDQTVNAGNFSSLIQVTGEQSVNIVNTDGTVNRIVSMTLPALSSGKLKLRSGITTTAKMFVGYYTSGKPRSFAIFKENFLNGVVKDTTYYEFYRFRYDATGKLNKIVTFINPANPCCTTPVSNDTIIYSGSQITSVTRRSPDPSKTGTATFQYNNGVISLIAFTPTTSTQPRNINKNGCYTCASSFYSSMGYSQNNNFGSTNTQVTVNNLYTKIQKMSLEDQLTNNGNNGGSAHNPDTYFFHPTMILQSELPLGSDFFNFFMIDWWVTGTQLTGPNLPKNDIVNFTFNYVK